MQKMAFAHLDLTLEKDTGGVRITKNGKSYLADKWKLREDVRAMIYLSISQCFNCLWIKKIIHELMLSIVSVLREVILRLGIIFLLMKRKKLWRKHYR